MNRFYAFCIQSNGNSLLVVAEICHTFHRNAFRKNRYSQSRFSFPSSCHALCFCFQSHFTLFIIFSRFIHCLLEIDQFLIYFNQSITYSVRQSCFSHLSYQSAVFTPVGMHERNCPGNIGCQLIRHACIVHTCINKIDSF